MALHKDLTGSDLHEPKGVASASAGQVYVANGSGSGVWTSKNGDILNANYFTLQGYMADIGNAGAPSGSVYFYIPQKCELVSFTSILSAAITTTNAVLSVYINGVLFADTLTVPFSGSAAGQKDTKTVTTSNTIAAGSVVEVRSDGGPANSVVAHINLFLRNKV
jgi:hypothetical protein